MKPIYSLNQWRELRKTFAPSLQIGFVPTMGNLHEGHASLLKKAKAENDLCVLSLFVNPTQFHDLEDYLHYPSTLEADLALATDLGVDYLLLPNENEIYHDQKHYCISEKAISSQLEGKHRPGHFEGMLTIVMKLFSLVKPTRAYFGEKDYQQLLLVQGMVEAFFLDIEIIPCQTLREPNGLALSSRNNRLTHSERKQAQMLSQVLLGSLKTGNIAIEHITAQLIQAGFEVDYVEIWQKRLLAAVRINRIRLIDNIPIDIDNHRN